MIKKAKYRFKNKSIFCVNGSIELTFPQLHRLNYSIFWTKKFSDIDKSIQECYRVLKYGGRFYCLEFRHPTVNQ